MDRDTKQSASEQANNLASASFRTMIATPTGARQIEDIEVSDQVLAASVGIINKKFSLTWKPVVVDAVFGTHDRTGEYPCLEISFARGTQSLRCTPNQPFLLANGNYIQAHQLRPAFQLLDRDANPVEIDDVGPSRFAGGVQDLAVNGRWMNNPDGHLLLLNGVVAGDYLMQLHNLSAKTTEHP